MLLSLSNKLIRVNELVWEVLHNKCSQTRIIGNLHLFTLGPSRIFKTRLLKLLDYMTC